MRIKFAMNEDMCWCLAKIITYRQQIARLVGGSNGGLMISRGRPKEVGEMPAALPLRPPRISYEAVRY